MKPPLVLLALVLGACNAPSAASQGCEGALVRLMPYAGSYDADAVLNDPDVAAALARLMGGELAHLQANINVRGAVDLVECHLVVQGNADHAGGEEDGIVAVSVYAGTVAAAVHSGGGTAVYVDGDYSAVPLSIKDWLAVIESGYRYRADPPANARVVPPGGR
jgi:hypothetical protein